MSFKINKIFFLVSFFLLCLSSTNLVLAQNQVAALSFETAKAINENCQKYAREVGIDVAIAIYDQGGNLMSFSKMSSASPAAGEVARWKGLSAAIYQVSSLETAAWKVPNAPKISTVQGGVPCKSSKPFGQIHS